MTKALLITAAINVTVSTVFFLALVLDRTRSSLARMRELKKRRHVMHESLHENYRGLWVDRDLY